MNHQLKWFACGIGSAALAFGFVACVDAYSALMIEQVQVLSADCSVPATATLRKDKGVFDVGLPDAFNDPPTFHPYLLPLLITNTLDSVGGTPATEMNYIKLQHFTVELSAPGVIWNASCPATFDTEDITVSLAPGASIGASLNIITAAHSQCLLPQVPEESLWLTAKVKAIGRHGGTSIKSAYFTYSVAVCKGCLQQGYTDSALLNYVYPADYPACNAISSSSTNPYAGDKCLPAGQDATILCCGATNTVNGVARNVAICPGVFTGSTATATATATATTTATATATATDTATTTTTTTATDTATSL
jgi:hypothetical protein